MKTATTTKGNDMSTKPENINRSGERVSDTPQEIIARAMVQTSYHGDHICDILAKAAISALKEAGLEFRPTRCSDSMAAMMVGYFEGEGMAISKRDCKRAYEAALAGTWDISIKQGNQS